MGTNKLLIRDWKNFVIIGWALRELPTTFIMELKILPEI